MTLSLNEVEATSKRAVRGAGYSWGVAEDASKAARWLASQGIDATAALAGALDEGFADNPEQHTPNDLRGIWQADGALCPLLTGASLSDVARLLLGGPIELKSIACPVLIVPFAATAALTLGSVVSVTGDGWEGKTDGCALSLTGDVPESTGSVVIAVAFDLGSIMTHQTRLDPDPAAWAKLNEFAQRTYAPATEESRRLGAGAGTSDND